MGTRTPAEIVRPISYEGGAASQSHSGDLVPTSLDALLGDRAKKLAPTSAQLDAASRSQKFLRELLDTGQMGKRIVESYLIGSYARHTALQPLDDVDIVFVIDPTAWQNVIGKWLGILPPPERVLESFARAIRSRYEGSTVRVQTRSVGLRMHHLNIDAVPAIKHAENANWIYVPDRKAEKWLSSGPRVHSTEATSINKRLGGRFVPLVRLLKAWNEGQPSTVRLKGFVVETLATRLFGKVDYPTLLDGLVSFFDFLAWCGGNKATQKWSTTYGLSFDWPRKLPDTASTGQNLFANVDADRLARFTEAARVTRDVIDKAQRARSIETAWDYLDNRFPL